MKISRPPICCEAIRFGSFFIVEQETDKIHVISLAGDWEIESQSGVPLAHENDKGAAIDTARELARQRGIPTVILHHGDGVTEEIAVADS